MDNQVQFKFVCPHCGQHLAVESDMIGMELECPSCGQKTIIPGSDSVKALTDGESQKCTVSPEGNSSKMKWENVKIKAKIIGKAVQGFSKKAWVKIQKAALGAYVTGLPIARDLKARWKGLNPLTRKRIAVASGAVLVCVLAVCIVSGRRQPKYTVLDKKAANEMVKEALSGVSDLKADLAESKKERDADQRRLRERLEQEAREREAERKQRAAETKERAEKYAAEEEARKRLRAEEAQRREEMRIADEQRKEAEKLAKEKMDKDEKEQAERYAKQILEPLNLKPEDFGWKTIPDSPKTDYALAAKAALNQLKEGEWMMAALCLACLDKSKYVAKGDMRGTVDLAASVIERVQRHAKILEKCLSSNYCHLEPKIHVQRSIEGKVSVSLKGKYYAECLKLQRNNDLLGLLNAITLQDGDDHLAEAYPAAVESGTRAFLATTKFILACKSDIVNNDNWQQREEPKLGFLTISLSRVNPETKVDSYYGWDDLVDVEWKEFKERLPSDDGYMKQGWDLLVSDVYILHTNYEKVYASYVWEMGKRISDLRQKLAKEVKLGDITDEEAKAKVVKAAQDEAASFAKLVENGTLEDAYQDTVRKAKAEEEAKKAAEEEAYRKKLVFKAEKELFSQNFSFKVFASKTLVAKGISVTMLGENASIWKDLQDTTARKDWKRLCDILRTRCNEYGENYWTETDEWERQIDKAHDALMKFKPTFCVKIDGEDVAKQCEVVFFLQDSGFMVDRGLDNYYEESASVKKSGSYRIGHEPMYGDFAIVHINDIKNVEANEGDARDFSMWHNSWIGFSKKAQRVLEGKLAAKEITKEQYDSQLEMLHSKIKSAFIKKCSLSPLDMKLPK